MNDEIKNFNDRVETIIKDKTREICDRYLTSGFGASLVGDQPYPPRAFKIKVSKDTIDSMDDGIVTINQAVPEHVVKALESIILT